MKKSIYVLIMALMVGIGAKGASYGNGDLRSIISAATDGEVIVLTGDTYTYASSSVLSVAKGFTVKADPSLTVRPTVTFSGSASQFFKFTATSLKSVTFDGIDFNGGGIASGFFNTNVTLAGDIDLTVNNCVIRNLTTASTVFGTVAATNSNGIYSSVKVTNSRILGYGMLVTSAGKTTSFANNSFKNTYLSNYAYTGANMIAINGGASSTLTIDHVTFNNCAATSRRIFNLTTGMTTTINNSVFKSCGQTTNNNVIPTAATGSGNINLSSTTQAMFGIPGTIATSPVLTNGTLPAVASLSTTDSWYYAASGTAGYYNAATFTKSVTTLSGLAYNEGSGPSTASTFTVSGADLFNNLTVTAPANYEVSSDGTTYASSLNLSPTLGVVASQTVYVRLVAGLTAASYTGDITLSSANLSNQTIALSGTVSAGGSPAFTASTGSLTGFNYIYNQGPSTEQSFTVSGSNLSANVEIAAPTNYEVSLTSGSGFGTSVSIPFGLGTLTDVPVYVQLKAGLNSGSYNGENVALTSTGATAQGVTCTGTVTPPTVTITPSSLTSFFALAGSATPSTEKTFTVGGSNLAGDITITPSTNYEISTGTGLSFSATNPITLTKDGGNAVATTTIYVRLKGSLATASYNENITVATAGTSDATVACSGNVATPIVKVGVSAGADNKFSLATLSYVYGAGPSASQSGMYVSGDYLQGDVTVTAPTGFEVSKDNTTFSDAVTFTMSNQTVSGQVWNRLKAGLNTDTYTGNVVYSSTGAANRNVAAAGSVTGGAVIYGLNASFAVVSTIPTPFTYAGNGPSASSNTIRITCSGLTSDVTITPSAGFEVSTDGTNFQSTPMDIANDGAGNIAAGTIIYTRMAGGLSVGAKTGTITLTATNATTRTVTVSGTVLLTPTVTVTPIGTYTYNGSPQGPIAATNTGTGTSYTFSYVGTGTTIYSASVTRPTELGTYSATATVAAHGNYAQASSAATAFNITTETVNTGGNLSDIVLTDPELANTNITVSSGELIIDATKTVRSITVNSGAKLTIPTGQTLTLTSLTLKSDASGTSTYKPEGNGALVITGTTNVEQYLANTRNYYVSSPVSNAVAPAGYTYYGRNETLSNLGWVAVSVGAGLTAGKGYIALPGTGDAPITFTTQSGGTLNTGTIPVSLTYTSSATSGKGYNLIGNPYPSHLNWTKAFTDANVAKIEPTIWYRSKAGNGNTGGWSFKTYNANTGDAVPAETTGKIPPMQGFWVLAKQTTTIDFTDDMRSHETGNLLKAPAANNVDRKKVRLQVSNGTRADEALLVFDANASDNYDSYDSPKMMNNATDIADIYTVTDAKKLVINGMNTVKYDTEIPIGFSTGSAGDFSISANEFSNFEIGTRLILLDKNYPTIETELTPETTYHFSAPVTTASTNRFSLLFRAPGTATGIKNTEKLHVQVFVNAANQITIIAAEKSDYAIYNAVGQLMENGAITSNSQTSNIKLAAGIYVVMVGNNSARVIIK